MNQINQSNDNLAEQQLSREQTMVQHDLVSYREEIARLSQTGFQEKASWSATELKKLDVQLIKEKPYLAESLDFYRALDEFNIENSKNRAQKTRPALKTEFMGLWQENLQKIFKTDSFYLLLKDEYKSPELHLAPRLTKKELTKQEILRSYQELLTEFKKMTSDPLLKDVVLRPRVSGDYLVAPLNKGYLFGVLFIAKKNLTAQELEKAELFAKGLYFTVVFKVFA